MADGDGVLVTLDRVTKAFGGDGAPALREITAEIRGGRVTGMVGPDGAGKTTLMRLMAALLLPTGGSVTVCGHDTGSAPGRIHEDVGYMPQRFGLYEDLTVGQNLALYADLRGVTGEERREAFGRLLEFTGLAPFTGRLAGKLSGGMKQKLGLACSLIRTPKLLLLDEPSVGVDPVSRRELWAMVYALVDRGIGVVWSTAYLDEAERCAGVLLLDKGKLLYGGTPSELTKRVEGRTFAVRGAGLDARKVLAKALGHGAVVDGVVQGQAVRLVVREGAAPPSAGELGAPGGASVVPVPPRFEDAFVSLVGGVPKPEIEAATGLVDAGGGGRVGADDGQGEAVVEAVGLTKRFGDFTAAGNVSFAIRRGEVFGLLGPNGAGKSTVFKMMCGLLRPTAGEARVAGVDLVRAAADARARLGYMAQKFSLYGDLSVRQNLRFFAGVYGLRGRARRETIERMIGSFDLGAVADENAGALPLGFKQRLALACAIMHGPAVLFLDEPTSGVDPVARREFWARINAMVGRGVTVMVTTHFLDEAEYCDRIALVYRGRVIATGTPDELKARVRTAERADPTLEDAFVRLVEKYDAGGAGAGQGGNGSPAGRPAPVAAERHLPLGARGRRALGLLRKEGAQILRDPSSLIIAGALPLILLVLFGFGVSLDLKNVDVAVVLEGRSPQASRFLQSFEASRYFRVRVARDRREVEGQLVAGRLQGVVVLPSDFATRLGRGNPAPVQVLVRGTDPNTAALVQNYVQGAWATWLAQESLAAGGKSGGDLRVVAEPRVWFNPALDSRSALLPGSVAVIMTLIGTLLTALVIAREWERGTMEALLATPVTRGELLFSKFAAYFVLGMAAMALSVGVAHLLLGVPLRGSLWVLALCSAVFLSYALGLGLLISTVTANQFVASQLALIAGFLPAFLLSGLVFEINSMPWPIRYLTYAFPPRYFVTDLQTLFLAGDVWSVLGPNTLVMVAFAAAFLALTARKSKGRLE